MDAGLLSASQASHCHILWSFPVPPTFLELTLFKAWDKAIVLFAHICWAGHDWPSCRFLGKSERVPSNYFVELSGGIDDVGSWKSLIIPASYAMSSMSSCMLLGAFYYSSWWLLIHDHCLFLFFHLYLSGLSTVLPVFWTLHGGKLEVFKFEVTWWRVGSSRCDPVFRSSAVHRPDQGGSRWTSTDKNLIPMRVSGY